MKDRRPVYVCRTFLYHYRIFDQVVYVDPVLLDYGYDTYMSE